jgi:zinc transport system substrate-binding protein
MRMWSVWLILIAAFISVFGMAVTAGTQGGHVKIFVSIVPQKYFVEKIGGNLVDVSVMVDPGASPATYEPKPKQMAELSKTKVYFAIGVPFEKSWLKKIATTNPGMLVVRTEKGIEKLPMKASHQEEDPYQHTEKDDKGIKDPHVWTAPMQVMVLARNILKGLLEIDPTHGSVYEANYKKFLLELVDLDAEIRGMFAGKKDVRFMVFHPAWRYFADAYGLEQVTIEIEGKKPKPAQLRQLIERAKEQGVKVIFVQPQFSTKSAEIIARAIDGQIVFADPLHPDWADNLREQAAKFKAALR